MEHKRKETERKTAEAELSLCFLVRIRSFSQGGGYVRFQEQKHSGQEHNGQRSYADVYAAAELADNRDQHGSRKGSPFSADIIKPEIFTGLVRRNDLYEVGARQGLNGALEHAYRYGQDPELILL